VGLLKDDDKSPTFKISLSWAETTNLSDKSRSIATAMLQNAKLAYCSSVGDLNAIE